MSQASLEAFPLSYGMVGWLSFIIGLTPAALWLAFFLWEDKRRPEPKGLITSTFILGGAAAFIALNLQVYLNRITSPFGFDQYSPLLIFLMATIEEVVKFGMVYLWVSRRREFNEPIDAMIYMIVAALGFATVENIASAAKSINAFELVTLRFVGATLLHSLSSGLIGFYWARGMALKGLVIASIVHSAFNILVLIYGPALLVTVFLAFIGFFVLNDFEKLKSKPARSA